MPGARVDHVSGRACGDQVIPVVATDDVMALPTDEDVVTFTALHKDPACISPEKVGATAQISRGSA